ncbi:MAG: hypothetical protein KGR19_09785 [Acidobacteria bacterium]|nr:hypothetical protein [Acidobacteriota bacterium]
MTAAAPPPLAAYLDRPLAEPNPEALAAVTGGPMAPFDALALSRIDRQLDPEPLAVESGWCVMPDGVVKVQVLTPMPGVSAEMVDWWFDWHPREPDRYRAWHPASHVTNTLVEPARAGAKAHWGATHYPVERLGGEEVRVRIEFVAPVDIGFSTNALGDPAVATVVCGLAADMRIRVRHTAMSHVWLDDGDGGTRLRSHFWCGAVVRPDLPGALGDLAGSLLNRAAVRRRALPADLGPSLSRHCVEEFSNLAEILPGLYERFGDGR